MLYGQRSSLCDVVDGAPVVQQQDRHSHGRGGAAPGSAWGRGHGGNICDSRCGLGAELRGR